MDAIKIENGQYLSEEFTSVSEEHLMTKLISYIRKNSNQFINTSVNKNDESIKVIYTNENQIFDIIDFVSPEKILKRNLIRTIRLKLKFNEETKSLEIIDDPNSNKISYSITCNNKLKVKNSLFFDENAVTDHSYDDNMNDYLTCKYTLCRISFDQEMQIIRNGNVKYKENSFEEVYLCYNLDSQKFENLTYEDSLNTNAKINVSKLINALNEYTDNDDFKYSIKENGINEESYVFSNFKKAMTNFKMINRSDDGFLNFRSFASQLIFNQFIEKLDKNSISIFQ